MTQFRGPSQEQQAVIDVWGQGLAVMAGAGSGKTTTLVTKCVELLKRNPEARFAAVSFTERSTSDLRAKLTQRLTTQGTHAGVLSRHWVMTIHGLCATIIREYPREAGFDGEETMLSEPESALLWERSLEGLWLDDTIPDEVRTQIDFLLERESRDSVETLLRRVRELHSFGVLKFFDESQDSATRALGEVGRYVLDRYDRLKRRRGALDFNDLERGADRALDVPAVREAFQRRFDLVLVDEFQDTNPLQARIIWRFIRPDGSNLCVVGDPKQSIYRFRDADVSVFEDFCARLPVNLSLTWNFRSRPGIIDYANDVCGDLFEVSGMKYEALVPQREPGPEQPVVRLDVSNPAELGIWIRAEIDRGVALHDMALLLRKIRGNEKWLKALTTAGIPIAVGSGGLFWSDPRAREMAALLKWWDNPGNSLSGGVFLRAPWMAVPGLDDATLDLWIKQDPTWQKPFFASAHPVAQALKPLRDRIVRPGEVLMALLVSDEIEAELGAPLLGLWHRVEELSSRGLDFHAVVTEISLAVEQQRRERDVPPPRNQGQLSVLTLHGSKGLEFPHVILVDLGKKGRASDTPLLFWDREKGPFLGGRDADGDRDKKDPVEAAWREQEKKKNLAESKRLFYVAITRAQERLVLVCPELPELKEGERVYESEKAFGEDDWRAWVECAQSAVPRLELPAPRNPGALVVTAPDCPVRPSRKEPRLVRPRHSVTEWNLLSRCERAYEWTYIRPRPAGEGAGELGLFRGIKVPTHEEDEMSQRELGTQVHACLERRDFDGLRELEAKVGAARFLAEPVISWASNSAAMAPAHSETGRDVWTELAFEVPVPGAAAAFPQILVGSVDRLVLERTQSGPRFSIIDFKVTQEPKSAEALLESYQVQMELYAMGLRALDPEINERNLEALLINISSRSIQAVAVPLGQVKIDGLARAAAEIVAGREGRPLVGPLCRYCDFRAACPEGRKHSR